jgi:hypothetical protein
MASFYYPRGPFGPICDTILPDDDGDRVRRLDDDDDDGDDGRGRIIDGGPRPAPVGVAPWPQPITRCKTRVLENGETEYYDCFTEFDFQYDDGGYNGDDCIKDVNGECFNWVQESTDEFGLDDDFFVPEICPISCLPYDPDINIRPVEFAVRKSNGQIVFKKKYACEKSTPLTYGVNAVIGQVSSSISAKFSDDGRSIEVTGSGTGTADLRLEWDDNPNDAGTAVGSITVGGATFTQSGGEGSEENRINISGPSTIPLSFSGLNSANDVIDVTNSNTELHLLDGDGDDINAKFILRGASGGGVSDVSLWNSEADKYAVWTNPAQCTLPCLTQEVTYRIFFNESNTYYFEFGADDTGDLYFNDEVTPFASAGTPSMLNDSFPNAGAPTRVAKNITAGIHLLTAKVTNSPQAIQSAVVGYVSSNNTLVSSSGSIGTISLGAGTAIRNELDGFSDTSGQFNGTLNEVGGFNVPSDSPTQQYLSFGTLELTGTPVSTRTASITMDLSGATSVTFTIIAGSDFNGGERPNDVGDTMEINFGNGWNTLAPSKQSAGVSFDEYDRTYGNWYTFTVNIPSSMTVPNATIQLRSGGDVPEIGGTYNGLSSSAFAAAYANCADVFGLYKVSIVSSTPGECEAVCGNVTANYDSWNWSKNPGGWYIKCCKGSPCISGESLPWVKSGPDPGGAWSDFMNAYAVWQSENEGFEGVEKTLIYDIYIEKNATLNLEYAADNFMKIYWDGNLVAEQTDRQGYTSSATTTFAGVIGNHKLTMKVTNEVNSDNDNSWSNNPAGGAWALSYQDDVSASFDSSGNLEVEGSGQVSIGLSLEWDDNPNDSGTALDTYAIGGAFLTQTAGVEKGTATATLTVNGGQTYNANITGNGDGFERKRNDTELHFFDGDGDDTNAKLSIVNVVGGIIRTSADLDQVSDGNLYWHTRMATGYAYNTNQNCSLVYTP